MRNMLRILSAIIFALGVAVPASAINTYPAASFVTANGSNVATFNTDAGVVTTQPLTTAALTAVTFTINCSAVDPTSLVMASVGNGTNTTGIPTLGTVTPGNAVVTVVIFNDAPAAAFNGTLTIALVVFN